MSLASFLNIQPSIEYGSAKKPNHVEKPGLEDAKRTHDYNDKFKSSVRDSKDSRNLDEAKDISKSDDGRLYVKDDQGQIVEIPLSIGQLQHLANLERVSLVDPDVLEQFGGLHAFVDAMKSLLSGTPELSSDDLVSLPYQIEALSEGEIGSETFPHLIATNLSPAELNILANKLEGLNKPISVTFISDKQSLFDNIDLKTALDKILSGTDEALSGEAISAAQLLLGSDTVGFGKWFQRPEVIESALGSRDIANANLVVATSALSSTVNGQGVNKSTMFEKIVSHFAQKGIGQPFADGSLNKHGLLHCIDASSMSNVSTIIDLDAHLHAMPVTASTANHVQNMPSHGVLGDQKAGQAHQATQLVATNIQKAVENGGNQKLSVLLDPPELGRVKIDVELDASNKLKVRMVTEREAAYMLLQRDSSSLEQTLQNSGIDIDSGDIELSFAGDGFFFGHEDRQEYADFGVPANKANGEGQDMDEDVIETQIDVFKDPYTGMWHYNIVV